MTPRNRVRKGITDWQGLHVGVHRNVRADGPGLIIQCELSDYDRKDSKHDRRYYCLSLTPANARKLAAAITETLGSRVRKDGQHVR